MKKEEKIDLKEIYTDELIENLYNAFSGLQKLGRLDAETYKSYTKKLDELKK